MKALYRKGVALYNLKDPSSALAALEKAKQQPGGESGNFNVSIIRIAVRI